MKKLPQFSVDRPVFASMMFLIVVVLGGFSFYRLQIDLLPNIEMPTVSIRTYYEGASPEVMERQVTQIIEEIVGTVPGVEEMTSRSAEGRSDVRVQFVWGTNIDTAALELQSTLEDEINELPDDIVRPRVSKYDINSYPIVILGVSSQLSPVDLTRIIEQEIRYEFSRVPGVSQVDTFGAYYPEIRIEVDPDRLQALGIPLNQVLNALKDSNLDLPSGQIESGIFEVTLRAPAQFQNLDQIRDTVVTIRNGAAITIRQIANVVETHEKRRSYDRVNGELGLRFGIRKEASANTVDVAKGVLAELDRINQNYPQIHIVPILNQGNFIELSIANVARSVLYGGALAILILLFFLRNLRSTIIISMAIPISIIATFALMYAGGLTLNLMTLGGLALGVGMMVDSSIVVLENIFRRRDELGEDPKIAAAEGAREVSGAILASTLTTLVIFLPLVFTRGVTGLLFRDLAYVIVFSLLCSLLVSLSLVPMLSSKLLKKKGEQRKELPAFSSGLSAKQPKG
jgi:hydrophobic/amphiphilic exporter-1 (mainly G- bacteria), HAE1 family